MVFDRTTRERLASSNLISVQLRSCYVTAIVHLPAEKSSSFIYETTSVRSSRLIRKFSQLFLNFQTNSRQPWIFLSRYPAYESSYLNTCGFKQIEKFYNFLVSPTWHWPGEYKCIGTSFNYLPFREICLFRFYLRKNFFIYFLVIAFVTRARKTDDFENAPISVSSSTLVHHERYVCYYRYRTSIMTLRRMYLHTQPRKLLTQMELDKNGIPVGYRCHAATISSFVYVIIDHPVLHFCFELYSFVTN